MTSAARATEEARRVTADGELDELVARALHRDRTALEALLQRLAPRVLAAVRGVLGRDASDAEDVAQESLVVLTRALGSFRGDCSVASFACGIAVRTALRSRRKWLRRWRIAADRHEREVVDAPADDPDDELLRARRLACLRALLAALPESQAEAFAMRCLLGDSLPEIAAATGTGINTIRSRIRLAKEALAERMRADPTLCDLFEVNDDV
jgi:RNA polymerase sigma-70 factor (ECF subfamily)